mmetsp:Transcript_39572/g.113925  ORF Transcript_39572/g.113925 Transcript_39572/m.113925 type:complete len:120 (-) Transcript_39572:112-471(-)
MWSLFWCVDGDRSRAHWDASPTERIGAERMTKAAQVNDDTADGCVAPGASAATPPDMGDAADMQHRLRELMTWEAKSRAVGARNITPGMAYAVSSPARLCPGVSVSCTAAGLEVECEGT